MNTLNSWESEEGYWKSERDLAEYFGEGFENLFGYPPPTRGG